ncbi:hypothetical protein ON010_g1058 [Phytophthora cinnamomi]|nr:hypothetical protein ON010_g1058 [Phytophthora cinnamomi]
MVSCSLTYSCFRCIDIIGISAPATHEPVLLDSDDLVLPVLEGFAATRRHGGQRPRVSRQLAAGRERARLRDAGPGLPGGGAGAA